MDKKSQTIKMKIIVGSKNKAKVEAAEDMLKEYPHFAEASIEGIDVSSDVSDQPKSLEETIHGAMNRARNAFKECDYSIGLESGLMKVPETKTGYMDVCVCAIYDGREFHLGLSSAWEYPKLFEPILNQNLDMSAAGNYIGLTNNPSIGAAEGVIGILTKGRLNRKEYTQQALRTALINLEND
jgi:inosine/xanthosine triphosphatase